ncbi:MAG TPA: HAD family hydrolase [Thermoanaerobaculia bacterium]|nr:HAD family hydrolase [Thermoanaerobaculia bacterium]
MTSIRAVAFDLWETLITDTPELSRRQERLRLQRMEEILVASGRSLAAETIEHAYRTLWHRCQDLYWSREVDVPCRRQIEHFLEALEIDADRFDEPTLQALEDAYATAAVEIPPALVPAAKETLEQLDRAGLRLGLISNTGRTPGSALRRILEVHDVAAYFRGMVFSNEHGACKPLPSIFAELRERLDAEFDEIVFVGDNLYVDVYGAQACGMRGVHFIPPVRGTAVAPPVDHGLEIRPDAVIRSLAELPLVLASFASAAETVRR